MRRMLWYMLIALYPAIVCGEGVTDFVINPATGYAIATSGSYRLSADVTMTNTNVNAITITADGVTLDLNGHTLDGGETGGTGGGISGGAKVTVRNGRIRRFKQAGVALGQRAVVEDLTVEECAAGIYTQGFSVVSRCIARGNTSVNEFAECYGILVGTYCIVRDCIASENVSIDGDGTGIKAAGQASISGCTVSGNTGTTTGYGIQCGDHATITGNNAYGNAGARAYGISAGNGGVLQGNSSNANTSNTSLGAFGIRVGSQALVSGNQCRGNKGTTSAASVPARGILAGTGSRIVGNLCSANESSGGSSIAAGIECAGRCTVEGNTCTDQRFDISVGSGLAYGIFVGGDDSLICGNATAGNASQIGIRINGGVNNRLERNRYAEVTGVSGSGGNSLGAGDLADVTY